GELVAVGGLGAVRLFDRREEQRPALEEEFVQDLVLGLEVVVDEAVGDPRLVGDVGDAGGVETLAGENGDRGVEDLPAFVDGAGALGGALLHQWAALVVSGQAYAWGRRLARTGSDSRTRSW